MNGKWYEKWCSFHGRKKATLYMLLYTIAFAVLFACTYLLFFLKGKSFIWYYDGVKQHFTALIYLGKYYRGIVNNIFQGNFVLPMYDFSIGMGEDIISSLNFYGLGDPLTLLAAFVPASKMELLYDFLVLFRMYLSGLAFSFMCRTKGKRYSFILFGAVIYAFSGYALHVAVKHPFFIIPMIFLPLAIVGVDRVIEKKRMSLLILVVFFTALNGFYFFYMNTIFLVIYAVVKVICKSRTCKETSLKNTIKMLFVMGVRCLIAYLIGLAMAAFIFVPTIAAYFGSSRSESSFNPGNLFLYDAKHYNYLFTGLIGSPRITWDFLGMAAIVVLSLVCAIFSQKKKFKILKVNIIIWTVLMLIPFGGFMLNGFSYVSGRFMYLVTLVYAVSVVEFLPQVLKLNRKKMIGYSILLFGYLVAMFFNVDRGSFFGWFGLISLVITLATIVFCSLRKVRMLVAMSALFVVVSLNLIGNGWLLFADGQQGYLSEFLNRGQAYEMLSQEPEGAAPWADTQFYRIDSATKNTQNACMVTDDYGVSSYFSIGNSNRLNYLQEVEDGGVVDSMFKIDGLDGRTFLDALASVKYFAAPAGDQENIPYGYKYVRDFKRGGTSYQLYENTMFLPLGVTFDNYSDVNADYQNLSGLQRQESMLQTVYLSEKPNKVRKGEEITKSGLQEISYTIQNKKHIEIDGDEIVVKKPGASLTIGFNGTEENETYLQLGKYTITQEDRTFCDITAKCQNTKKTIRALTNKWNWYFGRERYVFSLGRNKAAQSTCKIKFQCKGRFNISELKLYSQNFEEYSKACLRCTAETLQDVRVGTNEITGKVQLSQDKMMLLSIPFSNGWTAYVDGNQTKLYQADTAYMAIELEPGDHELKLVYQTPYIKTGFIISIFGMLAFLAYLIISRRMKEDNRHGL